MRVAQNGVQAFVAQALSQGVPFAMETVFSHWVEHADGTAHLVAGKAPAAPKGKAAKVADEAPEE